MTEWAFGTVLIAASNANPMNPENFKQHAMPAGVAFSDVLWAMKTVYLHSPEPLKKRTV